MATDAEVHKKVKRVAELRQQIADQESKAIAKTREADNDIQIAVLDAEEKRLEAELEAAKERSKVNVKQQVKAATAGPDEVNLDAQAAAATENDNKE